MFYNEDKPVPSTTSEGKIEAVDHQIDFLRPYEYYFPRETKIASLVGSDLERHINDWKKFGIAEHNQYYFELHQPTYEYLLSIIKEKNLRCKLFNKDICEAYEMPHIDIVDYDDTQWISNRHIEQIYLMKMHGIKYFSITVSRRGYSNGKLYYKKRQIRKILPENEWEIDYYPYHGLGGHNMFQINCKEVERG